jgi:tetratricopeptide (TPR) repeat protein/TolB-like protein
VSAVAQAPAVSPSSGPPQRSAPPARILVVPFENTSNAPQLHWLREAAAVLLTDGLRTGTPGSISRSERVHAFEQLYLPVSGSLSRATLIKVGQLVGATEVIVGSFRLDGSTLVVTARGIRLDAGRLQPEVVERGELTDLFGIFDRLTTRVSSVGGRSLASTNRVPLGAFENYIKGLLAENPVAKATFLETALREHAAFDRARLALWEVRAEQGDHAGALEALKPIAATSPASVTARFFTGISLIELKRYDEGLTLLKALLDATPSDASANAAIMNNLGVLLLRRGPSPQTGTPVYYLTKATDVEPDPDYMFNLGYAYAMDRNYQGAVYWLRESLRRDPADVDAHYVLAVALQSTGGTVEATRERDLARQLSTRYAELERRAAADQKAGVPTGLERIRTDPEGSRAMRADQTIVNSAQREQRELAAFHLDQGRRLFEREQDRDAMAELRRAVYLSPYEARAHLLIGRIHLRAGRPADAIDAFKISIWSQDQAPAHVYLAEAYLKTGDTTNARAEAQRALVLDPASADAKRVLSEIK